MGTNVIYLDFTSFVVDQTYEFRWNIKGFDRLKFSNSDHPVIGPVFTLGAEKTSWQILMCKNYVNGQKLIGFQLFKVREDGVTDFVTFDITLVAPDGKKLVCIKERIVAGEEKGSFTYFPDTTESSTATSKELVTNDCSIVSEEGPMLTLDEAFNLSKVTVECSIKYQFIDDCYPRVQDKIEPSPEDVVSFEEELTFDMTNLYHSTKLSDIMLIVPSEEGSIKIPAHQSILCARSPIFDKLIQARFGIKEVVLDMDPITASFFVMFLYSAKIPDDLTVEQAEKLRVAAEKYELEGLEDYCCYIKGELESSMGTDESSSAEESSTMTSIKESSTMSSIKDSSTMTSINESSTMTSIKESSTVTTSKESFTMISTEELLTGLTSVESPEMSNVKLYRQGRHFKNFLGGAKNFLERAILSKAVPSTTFFTVATAMCLLQEDFFLPFSVSQLLSALIACYKAI